MPLRSDWSEELCPVRRGLDVLGDPWIMLIMREVLHGRTRFEQIRDSIGISDAVLSRRLRLLVDEALLRKVDYQGERRTHSGRKAQYARALVEALPPDRVPAPLEDLLAYVRP